MAGIWEGTAGTDVHPVAEGTETDVYVERYELQPIDPQTNGPQYFYGLRYHMHIHKPGEVETFHDQVGYWLWNPVEQTVTQTIAIPRGQVALASGRASPPTRRRSRCSAERGSTVYGICSNPFLEHAYTTVSFRITVTVNADGTWGYDEDTVLQVTTATSRSTTPTCTCCTRSANPRPTRSPADALLGVGAVVAAGVPAPRRLDLLPRPPRRLPSRASRCPCPARASCRRRRSARSPRAGSAGGCGRRRGRSCRTSGGRPRARTGAWRRGPSRRPSRTRRSLGRARDSPGRWARRAAPSASSGSPSSARVLGTNP